MNAKLTADRELLAKLFTRCSMVKLKDWNEPNEFLAVYCGNAEGGDRLVEDEGVDAPEPDE